MPRARAVISHTVDLYAFTNRVVARMVALLDMMDVDLMTQIEDILAGISPSEFALRRLESQLLSVRKLNAQIYSVIDDAYASEMMDMVQAEIDFYTRLVGSPEAGAITMEQVYVAATKSPFQGRLLSGYMRSLEVDRFSRIEQTIALGYAEGRTTGQIVSDIFGTETQAGAFNIDRRQLENVVRTATAHYAAEARSMVYQANADIVQAIMWVATLDERTSATCRLRDGTLWTLDGEPIGHDYEWLGGPGECHFNCRSSSVPVIDNKVIDLSKGRTRASVDGPVPATLTYAEWLKEQSAARQDEILGPTRGALMRQGGYDNANFYDNRGRFLTIEELRARDARTFEELGL
jgi:SPP1 gp7 family putative phage head morphogenesis protein